MIKKVLIYLEDNTHSIVVAEKGILLAKELNASISIMHSIDTNFRSEDCEITKEFVAIRKREIRNFVQKILKNFNCVASVYIEEGNVQKNIIEKASNINASVIVLGTYHRKKSIKIMMIGLAKNVVKYSDIPVLFVSDKFVR